MRVAAWVYALGLAVALLGCAKFTNTGGSNPSCNIQSAGTCLDYVGSSYSGTTSQLQSSCSQSSGTFSQSMACTATGRVGSCDFGSGSATEINYRWYSPYTTSTAQTACQALQVNGQSGTFTAN